MSSAVPSRSVLRRALALVLLASALVLLWCLRDHCYGHGVGPRGPLHCYKLNETLPTSGLALLSVACGVMAVLRGAWFRRMAWCQAGLGIAAILAAYGPIWISAVTSGERERAPLVEVFFALAAGVSWFGTWLGRPERG